MQTKSPTLRKLYRCTEAALGSVVSGNDLDVLRRRRGCGQKSQQCARMHGWGLDERDVGNKRAAMTSYLSYLSLPRCFVAAAVA